MQEYLKFALLIPLVGLIISAFPNNKQEKFIFWTTILTVSLHLLGALCFTAIWANAGFQSIFYEGPTLYHSANSTFSIDLYFDKITVVFGVVSSGLVFLVSIFSRYYMHREKGFKRFFNNLLIFYFGINIILFSGNFETLFIGWEVIGIASFFLIAFYRDRYLPVKNALKVVSLYRLADIFLLIGVWLCHHVFEKSITFADLQNLRSSGLELLGNSGMMLMISLVFLVVATIKSAQFPFSSWLPRAMEGPTTSSAIFYGSLSVHIGVFLLFRTQVFWEHSLVFKVIIVTLGLISSLVATSISRVQSSVKTQIAYSSIAQIGLMFIELGFGFNTLALLHFASNATLRTYQLLVSPSVLNYMIHDQFFNFVPPQNDFSTSFWGKMKTTLYVLSIKEWNLDNLMKKILWNPIKALGHFFQFLTINGVLFLLLPFYLIGLYFVYHRSNLPENLLSYLPVFFAVLASIMALRAFVERKNGLLGWFLILLNQLFTSLSIAYNEQFDFTQVHLYLSGIILFGALGAYILYRLMKEGQSVSLEKFQGLSYERPRLTLAFVVATLGLTGFPISPTFIGEDLMFSHIHQNQYFLTFFTAFNLVIVGLSAFRIYARIFLGPHESGYHEVAYRSS
jgi:NADH-quinone oxidoreductase subunit L